MRFGKAHGCFLAYKVTRHLTLLCCQLALLWLCIAAHPVRAQTALDPSLEPEAGTLEVVSSFNPDPYRVPLVGGGDIDANSRGLGQDCVGFIANQPDFRLSAQNELPLLRFIFIADTITSDTSLVVRTPDGRFLCNDNVFGIFNPMVDVVDPIAGDYVVWVGGFSAVTSVYGDLYITTSSAIIPGSTGVVIPITLSSPTPTALMTPTSPIVTDLPLNAALPAAQGSVALEAGFLPDPYWTVIVGGGRLAVPVLNENVVQGVGDSVPECGGYTDSAPDFRVEWSGRSTRLRFHFIPLAVDGIEPDAALVVQSPSDEWKCNRDFAPDYTRPSVEFINPAVGSYHVWVADELQMDREVIGVLYITEITTTPETVRQVITPPILDLNGLDAGEITTTVTNLTFTVEPFSVSNVVTSGAVDVGVLNPDVIQPNRAQACTGYYDAAPTLVLNSVEPLPYLRAYFIAESADIDPTMIVRMPDGQWYCGDDSFESLNPTIHVIGNPSSGTIRVWVGSSDGIQVISGTLYFTRSSASPSLGALPTPTLVVPVVTAGALPTAVALPTAPAGENPAGLNPFAEPTYGVVSLGAVIVPHTLEANAGGTLDATTLSEDCVGYVTAQPDYRVQWSGTGGFLRFYFVGLGDSTLVVYAPDGTWHCNDDSFVSVNPTVDVLEAVPGIYNIWIGSFDAGLTIPGTLYITENINQTPG